MRKYLHQPHASHGAGNRAALKRRTASSARSSLLGNTLTSEPRARASAPPIVHGVLRSPGQRLDAGTQRVMEARFGQDLSRVRVHADERAAESARAVGAAAYTVGSDVVFADGQYRPHGQAGIGLLAHELTHVVQQSTPRSPASRPRDAEAGAHRNSAQIQAGSNPGAITASTPGTLQRKDMLAGDKKEKKKKNKLSIDSAGTKKTSEKDGTRATEGKSKFSFKADFKVPVTDQLSFGSVSFLDSIKVTPKATKESDSPISPTATNLDLLETKLALQIARLQLDNIVKNGPPQGTLSFGATLGTFGSTTFDFGESYKTKGKWGASLGVKASATSRPLSLGSGDVTFGSKGELTGTLAQGVGGEEKLKPSAEGNFSVGTGFKSKPLPGLGLGGILGDAGSITFGAQANVGGSAYKEVSTGKVGGDVSLGIAGKNRFLKLTVGGEAAVDLADGKATSTSGSVMVGGAVGGNF